VRLQQTWTVQVMRVATKMPKLTNAEFAFHVWFCDGDALTALREYQHEYPDLTQPYRCVFETTFLSETGTLTLHALTMEDATCWILYTVTHHPALIRFLLQHDFLRMWYGALCLWISCISFPCTVSTKVASRAQTSPVLWLIWQYLQQVAYVICRALLYGQCKILMFITFYSSKGLVATFLLEL
jgi:hypothetical protein